MAGFVGQIGAFDSTVEDWATYIERVEQYIVANKIENDRKTAVLLSVMGPKTYNLLRNLMSPNKPASKPYKEIVKVLQEHLNPKPLVIAERFRFHNRNQKKNESVTDYMAELRRLSEHCEFKEGLSDALRDRLVCGLVHEGTQKRLLTEKDLTLARALEIAVSVETAAKDAVELQKKGSSSECTVNKMTAKRSDNRPACYRCGKKSHSPDECWFKDKDCNQCNRRGHIQKVCKTKQKERKPNVKWRNKKVNEMNEDNSNESNSDEYEQELACLELHSVKENKQNVIWVTPEIEGQKLKMELDTGSALSIISYKDYKNKFAKMKLKHTPVTLKTYTGEKVSPLGKLKVKVKYEKTKRVLDLYVVQNDNVPLFGREWLRSIQLNWKSIKVMEMSSESTEPTPGRLRNLLDRYSPVFQDGIGTLAQIKAKVALTENAQPKFHKARNLPYALRPKVEAELKRLEDQGILSKVEWSEWATPIVPVVKKSGALRICGDFKVSINPVLQADQYPLPRIEDIFASLAGGQHFSKIDLAQAYLQMELEESSKKYLTINTHKGLFQYNRLVFGIASAPAVWQRAIDQVLQDIPGTQCYLDDILVTGSDENTHLTNLETVLKRLSDFGLRVNKEKCEFFKDSIEYCGHKIDKDGLHKAQDKIDAVLKAPRPENVSQLRSFLGLVNYYAKFLPNIATVLHPLNSLLQVKTEWRWTKSCEQAFMAAKQLITSEKVLTHYNPKLPLRLACDASPYGIGAVLSHKMKDGSERPIAFASRSLNKAEQNYAQIDREGLSLVWGVKKFNQYLYGKHFTLITDHQPLVAIFSPSKSVPTMMAARLQRWSLFLGAHDYTIEFKGTKLHGNADGLSRLPLESGDKSVFSDPAELFHMTQMDNLPVTFLEVKRETGRDPTMVRVYDLTVKGWPHKGNADLPDYANRREQLSVCQGCVMWGTRVIIPPKLRDRVLESLHDGHQGVVKMKSLARSHVWWPGIDHQIEDISKSCLGCLQNQRQPQVAPPHTWEWPSTVWQRVHIDYAGPFLDRMFLVVVDAYSKWPEVFPVKNATSTVTIETLRTLFARTGLPQQLVSDNGSQFTSEEFQMFMKRNGIKHITTVPFHPATNGLAERFVQTFKHSMKAMANSKLSISEKLANFLLSYRNTEHSTTGQTPSVLFMGRSLRSRLDLLKPDLHRDVSKKQSSLMKKQSPVRTFHEGQSVIARDYRHGNKKWQTGEIVSKTGPLTYTVRVPPGLIWRRHVDQLLDSSTRHSTRNDQCRDADCADSCEDFTSFTPGEPPDEPPDELNAEPAPATDSPAASPRPVPDVPERRYPERERHPPQRLEL